MLKLEFPNETHREMYEEFIQELKNKWEKMKHPDSVFDYEKCSFIQILKKIRDEQEGIISDRVPATTLFLVDTEKNILLWAISIRHHINHPNLIHRGGHVGYGIRPSERKKWYATQMLSLAFDEVKKIGLSKILLTCVIENTSSQKVIIRNGWIFESEQIDKNNERFYRYWITL